MPIDIKVLSDILTALQKPVMPEQIATYLTQTEAKDYNTILQEVNEALQGGMSAGNIAHCNGCFYNVQQHKNIKQNNNKYTTVICAKCASKRPKTNRSTWTTHSSAVHHMQPSCMPSTCKDNDNAVGNITAHTSDVLQHSSLISMQQSSTKFKDVLHEINSSCQCTRNDLTKQQRSNIMTSIDGKLVEVRQEFQQCARQNHKDVVAEMNKQLENQCAIVGKHSTNLQQMSAQFDANLNSSAGKYVKQNCKIACCCSSKRLRAKDCLLKDRH